MPQLIGIGISVSHRKPSPASSYVSDVESIVGASNIALLLLAEDAVTDTSENYVSCAPRAGSGSVSKIGAGTLKVSPVLGHKAFVWAAGTNNVRLQRSVPEAVKTNFVAAQVTNDSANARWISYLSGQLPYLQASTTGSVSTGATTYRDGSTQVLSYDADPHTYEGSTASSSAGYGQIGADTTANTLVGALWVWLELTIQLTANQRSQLNAATARYLSGLGLFQTKADIFTAGVTALLGPSRVARLTLAQDTAVQATGYVGTPYSRVGTAASIGGSTVTRVTARGSKALLFGDDGSWLFAGIASHRTTVVVSELLGGAISDGLTHSLVNNSAAERYALRYINGVWQVASGQTILQDGAANTTVQTGPHLYLNESSDACATTGQGFHGTSVANRGFPGYLWGVLQITDTLSASERSALSALIKTYLSGLSLP